VQRVEPVTELLKTRNAYKDGLLLHCLHSWQKISSRSSGGAPMLEDERTRVSESPQDTNQVTAPFFEQLHCVRRLVLAGLAIAHEPSNVLEGLQRVLGLRRSEVLGQRLRQFL
jgi:hypothetical protein